MAGVDHAVQRQIIALATKSAENPYCTINMQILLKPADTVRTPKALGRVFILVIYALTGDQWLTWGLAWELQYLQRWHRRWQFSEAHIGETKMNKALQSAAAGFAAAFITLSAPQAAEPFIDEKSFPGAFSANIGLFSEYYFRGISQTDDAPALQGGLDWSATVDGGTGIGVYLGVWGSNVDFNEAAGVDGATIEIDYYGSLTGDIGSAGLGWDVGFIYYTYPGAAGSLDYDFVEGQGALSYDFGFASATVSLNYSPQKLRQKRRGFLSEARA
ncbi:MAG: TorF family putative porin [Alphaproteobacteria bacterium]|nr:TorF family putative porin [Alphaproteobacteria bacterium]